MLQKLEERYLLMPKILYFAVNLQYYTLHQFRPRFARMKFGVSTSLYGKMSGIIMFSTFFTNIMIGGVSDKTGRPKGVLLFLTAVTAGLFALFYVNGLMGLGAAAFWGVLFLYLIFNNPKQPLLDKIVLDYLGKMSAGPKVYGKQRMWGTVAYTAATLSSEWCLKIGASTDSKGKVNYNFDNLLYYSFITTGLALFALLVLTSEKSREVPGEAAEEAEAEQAKSGENQSTEGAQSVSMTQEYLSLLKNKEFLFFILIIFSNAITRSAMSMFLTSFHEEVLELKPYSMPDNWPMWFKSTVGLLNNNPITALTFFGTFFEVLVMFAAEPILTRLGYFWPLLIAQVCSLFRFFAYYSIGTNNPHAYAICCVVEFIKGIYFGLAHISSVQIATCLAPPHLKATSQMIYQGTFNALGSLMGGYIFGMMFDGVKGDAQERVFRQLFLINGFVSFATIALYFYKYGVRDRVLFNRQAEEDKLTAASAPAVDEKAPAPVAAAAS
ncbi:hypothetical protein PAPHI01_0470 [Pancytospora philotis]|nr:hypothetical protein PAPHI01_0470 [Pancytospora philotis]